MAFGQALGLLNDVFSFLWAIVYSHGRSSFLTTEKKKTTEKCQGFLFVAVFPVPIKTHALITLKGDRGPPKCSVVWAGAFEGLYKTSLPPTLPPFSAFF